MNLKNNLIQTVPNSNLSLRRFELLHVPHQETILPLNQRLYNWAKIQKKVSKKNTKNKELRMQKG